MSVSTEGSWDSGAWSNSDCRSDSDILGVCVCACACVLAVGRCSVVLYHSFTTHQRSSPPARVGRRRVSVARRVVCAQWRRVDISTRSDISTGPAEHTRLRLSYKPGYVLAQGRLP